MIGFISYRWNTSNPWTDYSPVSVAWTVDIEGVLNYVREVLMKPWSIGICTTTLPTNVKIGKAILFSYTLSTRKLWVSRFTMAPKEVLFTRNNLSLDVTKTLSSLTITQSFSIFLLWNMYMGLLALVFIQQFRFQHSSKWLLCTYLAWKFIIPQISDQMEGHEIKLGIVLLCKILNCMIWGIGFLVHETT